MSIAFRTTVNPTSEPITLIDAKLNLRVDFSDDDAVIGDLITRARSLCETYTHRALATQTIQAIVTIERPLGGDLSGALEGGPNWYQFQEQLGANPFGASMFYIDLPLPPFQSMSLIESRTTVWDSWTTYTGTNTVDTVQEPARIYFQTPPTASQWRFTYVAGYDLVSYLIPPDLRQALMEAVAYFYNHREAEGIPHALKDKLLAKKVDWI